jgi:hypothetical protein
LEDDAFEFKDDEFATHSIIGRAALQMLTHWIGGAALMTHTLSSSLRIRQAFATPAREMRRLLHKSSTNLLMVGPHSLKPFIDPEGEFPYSFFENDIERILARGQNILKISDISPYAARGWFH